MGKKATHKNKIRRSLRNKSNQNGSNYDQITQKHLQVQSVSISDDIRARQAYQRVGCKYSDISDVNPYSSYSQYPYTELRKTGENIPHMLRLMESDTMIIEKRATYVAHRTQRFKEYTRKIQEHLKYHEEMEDAIDADKWVVVNYQNLIMPSPDKIKVKAEARVRARANRCRSKKYHHNKKPRRINIFS